METFSAPVCTFVAAPQSPEPATARRRPRSCSTVVGRSWRKSRTPPTSGTRNTSPSIVITTAVPSTVTAAASSSRHPRLRHHEAQRALEHERRGRSRRTRSGTCRRSPRTPRARRPRSDQQHGAHRKDQLDPPRLALLRFDSDAHRRPRIATAPRHQRSAAVGGDAMGVSPAAPVPRTAPSSAWVSREPSERLGCGLPRSLTTAVRQAGASGGMVVGRLQHPAARRNESSRPPEVGPNATAGTYERRGAIVVALQTASAGSPKHLGAMEPSPSPITTGSAPGWSGWTVSTIARPAPRARHRQGSITARWSAMRTKRLL